MIGEQATMTDKELDIILQEGESYKIEFKESVDKTLVEEEPETDGKRGKRWRR
jgi:hypothetical protein